MPDADGRRTFRIERIPVADHWRLPVSGCVEQVAIDYAFSILVTEYRAGRGDREEHELHKNLAEVPDFQWTLRIEAPFVLEQPGEHHALEPGADYPALAPALAVTNQKVTGVELWGDGRIRVSFANDMAIDVHHQPELTPEAWELWVEGDDFLVPDDLLDGGAGTLELRGTAIMPVDGVQARSKPPGQGPLHLRGWAAVFRGRRGAYRKQ